MNRDLASLPKLAAIQLTYIPIAADKQNRPPPTMRLLTADTRDMIFSVPQKLLPFRNDDLYNKGEPHVDTSRGMHMLLASSISRNVSGYQAGAWPERSTRDRNRPCGKPRSATAFCDQARRQSARHNRLAQRQNSGCAGRF